MNQRRRFLQIAVTGLTGVFLAGCGGGSKRSGGGEETPVPGAFVRLDLGRTPAEYRHVAVNASGQIALTRDIQGRYGFPFAQKGSTHYAYLWTGTGWKNLHGPRGNASVAVDINDRGQVLLYTLEEPVYYIPNGRAAGAFLYSEGTFTEIRPNDPDAENVRPTRLGEDGSVIGSYTRRTGGTPSETIHFLWHNGETITFPGFEALDINASGQIVLVTPATIYPGEWAIRQPDGQMVTQSRVLREDIYYPNLVHFTPTGILDDGTPIGLYGASPILLPNDTLVFAVNHLVNHPVAGRIEGNNHAGDFVINTEWLGFATPFLRRSNGEVANIDSHLPIVLESEAQYKRLLHDINDQGQLTGSYDARYSLSGSSVAFLLTPPTLAPNTGSASVNFSDVKVKTLNASRFVAVSVSGQLLAPHHLEAIVSTLTTSAGHRELMVVLNLPGAIEVGQSYPMSTTDDIYLTGRTTRVIYYGERPGARDRYESGGGSILVEAISEQDVTFRLVNIRMGIFRDDGTFNGPAFTLNATITVKR